MLNVADPIVSSGYLWMIKGVVSGAATGWVVHAYCNRHLSVTALLAERWRDGRVATAEPLQAERVGQR